MSQHPFTNRLIEESSPYLLQHAHNPVNWFAWGEEALQKAKLENKLLLISVGYSACHWCHVMEHESFEDEKVARIMNDLFVCIKVDREERPDIDQVYMSAVQLMTGQGGWPLNCFALPDGRPVYGGTYFQKERWMEILINLADLWKHEPAKCEQYAQELTDGIRRTDKILPEDAAKLIEEKTIGLSVEQWLLRMDTSEGGPSRAPKFPLPNNYLFLLRYAHLSKKEKIRKQVELTLDKMAMGGIYDQLGGGFARYSTDMLWKVPHFEKMLYDNAQLISLYAEAYQLTGKTIYKETAQESLRFVFRELTATNGAFYSALDADSEGEEGKFYVWTEKELKLLLREDYTWFASYYNVNSIGHWEHANYILLRRETDEAFAIRNQISIEELRKKIAKSKEILMPVREQRIRPGLDDKTLTSWNAMMCKACADSFLAFQDEEYLLAALRNARFIRDTQLREDGALWHSWKNGKSSINGFLEDYAFTIDAFIRLYEVCFDESWLELASKLMDYALLHFSDKHIGMFYFTSDQDPELISRSTEISDNVIPASNSVMARNLFYLGHFYSNSEFIARAEKMLLQVQQQIIGYGAGFSNWMILQLHLVFPFREMAITGPAATSLRNEIQAKYFTNLLWAGSTKSSELPLLKNRFAEDKTAVYICENNTCDLPVYTSEAVFQNLTNA
jgi:uncharacterized protein